MPVFKWARTDQHTTIIGMNGSGKSVFAAHMISCAPLRHMPYILIDYKNEELFNAVDRAKYIDFHDQPKEPGFYILKAQPSRDDEKVNKFLYNVLAKEKRGLIYDEGYSIPNLGAMETLYMQGRSKHIPILTLTQRPVWLSRYAFTEASHLGLFRLNDARDIDTVKAWIPERDRAPGSVWDMKKRLPDYYCRWYDSRQDASFLLSPAPMPDEILEKFDDKLRPIKKVY